MDTDLLLKAALAIGLVIILARCTGKTRERFTDYVPANRVPANSQLGQMALSVDSRLLPSEERPQLDYGEFKPPTRGLEGQTFLDPVKHVGISTIAGSNRNSNMGLRSEPPNPRIPNLSPWNNSTIPGQNFRRSLDC
jgi:hypothetical protein